MVAARIEFMAQLAKFSKDELRKQPIEGEWSPLELAHHLYIADGLALQNMRLVQDEDNPMVVAPEQEAPRLTRSSESPVSLESSAWQAWQRDAKRFSSTWPPCLSKPGSARFAITPGVSANSTNW